VNYLRIVTDCDSDWRGAGRHADDSQRGQQAGRLPTQVSAGGVTACAAVGQLPATLQCLLLPQST
jgi:hypothetical protein